MGPLGDFLLHKEGEALARGGGDGEKDSCGWVSSSLAQSPSRTRDAETYRLKAVSGEASLLRAKLESPRA